MTDNKKQFEDFVRQIKFNDTPDPSHRDKLEQDLLAAMAKQPQQKESPIKIWRTIMKTKIAKLATAAVIIIAVTLGLTTVLEHSATPAWAIEDTIAAIGQFDAIYMSGLIDASHQDFNDVQDLVLPGDNGIKFELWANANEQRTSSKDVRLQIADGVVMAVQNEVTYTYDPNSNTVSVEPGRHVKIRPWLSAGFFESIEKINENWQVIYGKDPATGRDRAFVTCSYSPECKSWWFEFDLESDLPVRFKQWYNTRREGAPAIDFQRIVYFEELPDQLFEFEIPEGATVIEK